jgi:uncharacterized membrane protein
VSDDAERWVYRLGAAAPLLVPWLIAPFQSALREGRHHIGKQIVGFLYLSGFWPYAVPYLVFAVIGLGLLWRRPAAAYRRAAAWISGTVRAPLDVAAGRPGVVERRPCGF